MRHRHALSVIGLAATTIVGAGASALSQQPTSADANPNVLAGCPYHGMGYGMRGMAPGMMGWGRAPWHGYGHMGSGMGYGVDCGYRMGPGYQGKPRYRLAQGYGRQGGLQRFPLVDRDENGIISAAETAAHAEEVFLSMDADANGNLTLEEFSSVHLGPQWRGDESVNARRQQRKAERFAEMNADGDELLTREEFMEWHKARFEAADDDGDGNVTPWEFRSRR